MIDPKKLEKVSEGPPPKRRRLRSELTIAIVEVGEAAEAEPGVWVKYLLEDVDPAKMTQAMNVAANHLEATTQIEYRTVAAGIEVWARHEPF